MTTWRRYYWEHPGTELEGKHEKVVARLQAACERAAWFLDPQVGGAGFDKLTFEYTVTGRDQWFVHKRAMELAAEVFYMLGIRENKIPEPLWEPLEPHTNRGHRRVSPTAPSTPGGGYQI